MGNDQVRFDLAVKALGDYQIVAPIREIQKEHTQTRAYEQAYLEERGFGVRAKQKAYTINENLLGLTMSGGEIDRWEAPGEGARGWCAPRAEWPAEPLQVTLALRRTAKRSRWMARRCPAHMLLAKLNTLFAHYGVGRGMYTGDTTIGLKGRIVFEAPGLVALLVGASRAGRSGADQAAEPLQAGRRAQVGGAGLRGLLPRPAQDRPRGLPGVQPAHASTARWCCETQGGRVDAVAVRRRTSSTPRARPMRSRPTGAWPRPKASSRCTA